jgi:hypothetical protein
LHGLGSSNAIHVTYAAAAHAANAQRKRLSAQHVRLWSLVGCPQRATACGIIELAMLHGGRSPSSSSRGKRGRRSSCGRSSSSKNSSSSKYSRNSSSSSSSIHCRRNLVLSHCHHLQLLLLMRHLQLLLLMLQASKRPPCLLAHPSKPARRPCCSACAAVAQRRRRR